MSWVGIIDLIIVGAGLLFLGWVIYKKKIGILWGKLKAWLSPLWIKFKAWVKSWFTKK
jgi:hypothetical protein